jgi:hypothetical protein
MQFFLSGNVDTFDGHLQRLKRVYAAHKIQEAYKKLMMNRKKRETLTPEQVKNIKKKLTSRGFKLTRIDKNGKRQPIWSNQKMRNILLEYDAESKAGKKRMKEMLGF